MESDVIRLKVRPGRAGSKGRGVFATAPIAKGELIEVCPVIVVPAAQCRHLEPTVLELYIFNFGPDNADAAVVLGYGSLYNHSFSPNAEYLKDLKEEVVRFVALRPIEPGEEIRTNYNGSPSDQTPLWFETVE